MGHDAGCLLKGTNKKKTKDVNIYYSVFFFSQYKLIIKCSKLLHQYSHQYMTNVR